MATLTAGAPRQKALRLEGTIQRGECLRLPIATTPRETVELHLSQFEIDLFLRVYDLAKADIIDINFHSWADEQYTFLNDMVPSGIIEVCAASTGPARGRYVFKVGQPRRTTAADLHLANAERLLASSVISSSDEAIAQLRLALLEARAGQGRIEEASILEQLARQLHIVGSLSEARDMAISASRIWREIGDRNGQALTAAELSRIEGRLSQDGLRQRYANEEVTVETASPDRRLQAAAHTVLAHSALRRHEYASAQKHFLLVHSLNKALGDVEASLRPFDNLADLSIRVTKDPKKSLDYAQRWVDGLSPNSLLRSRAAAHFRLAAALQFAGRLKEAVTQALEAASLRRRGNETSGEASARVLAAEILIQLSQPEAAARETARARSLFEEQRRKLTGALDSTGGIGALESEARELHALASLQLYSLTHDQRFLQEAFLESDWTKGAYVTDHKASFEDLRQTLVTPDTCLLSFTLSPKLSRGWMLCTEYFDTWDLPPARDVISLAARYYSDISASPSARVASRSRAGEALSNLLLKPVEAHLKARRLIIAAPAELQALPFAGLAYPGEPKQFLGDECEIVQVPSFTSASQVFVDHPRRNIGPQRVAAFADATYSLDDPRVVVRGSTLRLGPTEPGLYRAVKTVRMSGHSIPRLLHTSAEANQIKALAPAARLWTGPEASKKNVLNLKTVNFDILHFAVHGVLNSLDPNLSGLVLAKVDGKGRTLPSFLNFSDVYGMKFDGQLIVLSACQTALGRTYGSAGMVTLSGAFLHAGASQVVATLWRVNDQASALLMAAFYEGIYRRNLAPAQALSYAQRRLRRTKQWQSPHYWAAFVIQGV